jgi:hypothetical protein
MARSAVRQSHPHKDQLERFMRNELSRREVAPIVRHMLTGCTQCLQVTRPLWELGERSPRTLED